jgi:hypothetical protein
MGKRVSQPSQIDFMLGFSGRSAEKMNLFEEISEHGIFHGITV